MEMVTHPSPDGPDPVPVGDGDPGDQLQVEQGGMLAGIAGGILGVPTVQDRSSYEKLY